MVDFNSFKKRTHLHCIQFIINWVSAIQNKYVNRTHFELIACFKNQNVDSAKMLTHPSFSTILLHLIHHHSHLYLHLFWLNFHHPNHFRWIYSPVHKVSQHNLIEALIFINIIDVFLDLYWPLKRRCFYLKKSCC